MRLPFYLKTIATSFIACLFFSNAMAQAASAKGLTKEEQQVIAWIDAHIAGYVVSIFAIAFSVKGPGAGCTTAPCLSRCAYGV